MATTQYLRREESRIAANYLIHCREIETNENILERIKQNERNIATLESRLDRKRTESFRRAYEKSSAEKITQEFMRQLQTVLKKKKQKLDPDNDEEILRRYSLLTKENVAKCVKFAFQTLNDLNTSYSTQGLIHEATLFLLRLVITVRIRASQSVNCRMNCVL